MVNPEAINLQPWETLITHIAKQLHKGKLKPTDLNTQLINKTFNQLNKGLQEGYGPKYTSNQIAHTKTVLQLQQNIYRFSAAKSYQQLKHFNSLLVDDNGKERNFNSFKTQVLNAHKTYNVNYLQAEYQTAKASAQMARKWQNITRNQKRYPNLRYKTVGDNHVRDDHKDLNNFVAAIDDNIWDKIYPPNDWRCRCYVQQTDAPVSKLKPKLNFLKPEFSVNVGKTGVVFNDKAHPYFIIPKIDKQPYKVAFEKFKLLVPYGKPKYIAKNGAKIFVHPFADNRKDELIGNYKVAITLAEKMKFTMHLTPHINGRVIRGQKNPEYKVNGKISDRKAPKEISYKNILRKANKQKCEIVIVDLHKNKDTISNAEALIHNILKKDNVHPYIKEVYIVSKDRKKIKHYKRKKQS